jgi:multidrug efflux pump subunit AcrA (membrane-fusion protein)
MKHPATIVRVVIILAIVSAAAYWFLAVRQSDANGRLTASGTIEAHEVIIAPEQGGRVADVSVDVGEDVTAGQALVRLDTSLLEGQLAQAQAQLAAAQANYDMLAAGPTAAQTKAGETAAARAQAQLDADVGVIAPADLRAERLRFRVRRSDHESRAERDAHTPCPHGFSIVA